MAGTRKPERRAASVSRSPRTDSGSRWDDLVPSLRFIALCSRAYLMSICMVRGLMVGLGRSLRSAHWDTAVQQPAIEPALVKPRITMKVQKNIMTVGVISGTVGSAPFHSVDIRECRQRKTRKSCIFEL